jgi:hypothetical protein
MPSVELNEVKRSCGGLPPSGERVGRCHRPFVAENDQPGISADNESGPEAQAHRGEKNDRHGIVASRHHVGERIAQREACDCDDQRGTEGVDHHVGIERNGEEAAVMIERERRVGDAEKQYVADRNDEQHDDAEHRRRHQQPSRQAIAGDQAGPPGCLSRRSFAHRADDVT